VPVEHSQPNELPSHFERFGQQVAHDSAEDLELPSAAKVSKYGEACAAFLFSYRRLEFFVSDGGDCTLIVVSGLMSLRLKTIGNFERSIDFGQPAPVGGRAGFRNLSGDSRDAWLSTAFADWLATDYPQATNSERLRQKTLHE